jgi:glutamine synthetase
MRPATDEGDEVAEQRTPGDVLKLAQDSGAEIVDLRFCDLPGLMQHFSMPIHELTADGFDEGYGFDGSSIRGFQEIQESDMLLVPDPNTAVIDPFREHTTLSINCYVQDPITGEPYTRDPRYVAKKAEEYVKGTGIADTIYIGPEAEFYIFDSARFDQNQYSGYYYVDSVEGVWNSGREFELDGGPNLGYKPRYKEGYFPVPPMDSF